MNKFLCGEVKKRGIFKRNMCGICAYVSRCIDYLEYTQGYDDEGRDAVNDARKEGIEEVVN